MSIDFVYLYKTFNFAYFLFSYMLKIRIAVIDSYEDKDRLVFLLVFNILVGIYNAVNIKNYIIV